MATIGAIAIGLIGGGMNARSTKKQGKRARAVGLFNAGIAEGQADDALARGREAEDRLRSGVRKLVGSQSAGFAGQGVSLEDADSSVTDVETDTYVSRDQDLERLRVNAAREAWGFRQQAASYRAGGDAAVKQANASANDTILGSLGNAYSTYTRAAPYRATKGV